MKLRLWIALFGTVALLAGEPARSGLVRGIIFELLTDEVSVRSAPGDIYRFHFDSRTWIERERERITGASLRTGELLEVISDRGGHYARLIHVLDQTVPRPPVRPGQFRIFKTHEEAATASPVIQTYTGVVMELQEGRLILRTRFDGLKTIYLKPDTRCLNGGLEVGRESLLPQMHIFVTTGLNSDAELEASEIIWGTLLQPK